MEEHAPKPGRSSKWGGIVVGAVVLFLLVGFVLPAWLQQRCGAQQVVESTRLRRACAVLCQRQTAGQEMPRSIVELFYDGTIDLDSIDHCTRVNYSRISIGKYSIREIARRSMTPEELDTELRRVYPTPPAWETIGPITLCLDAQTYATADAARIVGWMSGGHGNRRWVNVATSDQHVSFDSWLGKDWVEDSLDHSAAYYESRGIPMPEVRVKELREALGAE